MAIILSEQTGDITQPVEVLAGAFGLLLMAAFAHELTRTRRALLTFQEIALEYGLLMMVYGLYLLVEVFAADASQVMLIIFVVVLAFRLYSVKGELEAHHLEFQYSDYDTRREFFWDAIRKHEFTYLRSLYRFRATVTILALISGVYIIQLWVAGSTDYAAAYSVPKSLSPPEFLLGSPWFHSNHSHILWNAGMFTVFGWWLEKRIDSRNLFVSAILIGYVTNLLPFFISIGGPGLGVSGITNSFKAFFAASQITQAGRLYHSESTPVLMLVVHISLSLLVGFLVVLALAQALGFLPAPEGTAIEAHAIGIVLGLTWFFIQSNEYRFTWPSGFKLS